MGDEEDVDYQLMMTDSLVNILKEIENDVALLNEDYIANEKPKYKSFVESYGGASGIIKFRQQYETFLESARSRWIEKNVFYTLKSKWGVSENGADSIYLLANVDSMYHVNNKSHYFSVATTKDDAGNTFVVGIDNKAGKGKGFMAMVSNTRKIVWKENFDVTKFTYAATQEIVGKFIPAPAESMSAYMYSLKGNGKENLVIVNGKKAGQVAWINLVIAKNQPVSVKFNDLVKETVLYMKTEAEMESMADGEVAYYVIDRSGKIR